MRHVNLAVSSVECKETEMKAIHEVKKKSWRR